MRKHHTEILKEQFHSNLIHNRYDQGLTQEDMARKLGMASRTYVELDHGKSSCSALTLAMYLINVCPDPNAFLDELRRAMND